MAVTFTSSFYDGPTTEKQRAETWMGPQYGVRGAGDWKVTAVAGQDRVVSIAAGSGFGHGLADTTASADTIQLDTIASGSRWDMIARRANWQPVNGGPSQFVKINGSSTKGLPAVGTSATAWNRRPGIMDDQPIALCRVAFENNASVLKEIIDLRCWAANGGLFAVNKLALDYLNVPGARVRIGRGDYTYEVVANDAFEWVVRVTQEGSYTVSTTSAAPNQPNYISLEAGLFTKTPNIQLTWSSQSGQPPRLRTYDVGLAGFGVNVMSDVGNVSGTVHWSASQQ